MAGDNLCVVWTCVVQVGRGSQEISEPAAMQSPSIVCCSDGVRTGTTEHGRRVGGGEKLRYRQAPVLMGLG